jgi:predicted SAM-dependent methyltransferase
MDIMTGKRDLFTNLFILGEGIEIGALHNPLVVPENAKVKYVDRMTVPELRKQYPELNQENLVNVDIISDGEKLENINDYSQDFVIANHFLEHCQNPLMTLKNTLRVVKAGGIAYLAVPNKRYTFDVDKLVTKFEHLEKDYVDGPESSKKQHFEEWAEYVNKVKDEKAKKE